MDLKNKEENKKTRRKGYESLLLLLLIISLFVTATYAWFTDTAYSTGNKVFSGNMNVDVIVDQEQMGQFAIAHDETCAYYWDEYIKCRPSDKESKLEDFYDAVNDFAVGDYCIKFYTRVYEKDGETVTDTYYIITNTDVPAVNLYNVEPGQARQVSVKYLNTGDLAFKAAGALKIDIDENKNLKSYTGLQTLNRQFNKDTTVYYNDYAANEHGNIDPLNIANNVDSDGNAKSYSHQSNGFEDSNVITKIDGSAYTGFDEYEKRFNKLLTIQTTPIDSNLKDEDDVVVSKFVDDEAIEPSDYLTLANNPKTFVSVIEQGKSYDYYLDEGGKLEDVLEVYVGLDENPSHDIFENKDAEYYFGTLKQFQFVAENGSKADPNFDNTPYLNFAKYKTDEELARQFMELKLRLEGKLLYDPDDVNFIADFTEDGVYKKDNGNYEYVQKSMFTPASDEDLANELAYMALHEDFNANLYSDYDRYLSKAGGYCLPQNVVAYEQEHETGWDYLVGTTSYLENDSFDVLLYDADISEELYGSTTSYPIDKISAKEIGETEFYIYMPTDVDSKYENASISLSYGVTATQVEFEMDGFNCMVYDKNLSKVSNVNPLNVLNLSINTGYDGEFRNSLESKLLQANQKGYKFESEDGYTFDCEGFTESIDTRALMDQNASIYDDFLNNDTKMSKLIDVYKYGDYDGDYGYPWSSFDAIVLGVNNYDIYYLFNQIKNRACNSYYGSDSEIFNNVPTIYYGLLRGTDFNPLENDSDYVVGVTFDAYIEKLKEYIYSIQDDLGEDATVLVFSRGYRESENISYLRNDICDMLENNFGSSSDNSVFSEVLHGSYENYYADDVQFSWNDPKESEHVDLAINLSPNMGVLLDHDIATYGVVNFDFYTFVARDNNAELMYRTDTNENNELLYHDISIYMNPEALTPHIVNILKNMSSQNPNPNLQRVTYLDSSALKIKKADIQVMEW